MSCSASNKNSTFETSNKKNSVAVEDTLVQFSISDTTTTVVWVAEGIFWVYSNSCP